MSGLLAGRVWTLSLPRCERDVLLAMADHADDDGGRCYPSIDHLAWKTDYSARQVQRALASLKAKKIVEVEAGAEGGRGRLPEYRLHLDRASLKPSWESVKGDILSRRSSQRVTSATAKGDIQSAERVTSGATKGDIPGSLSIYETSLNHQTGNMREKGHTRPAPKPEPRRQTAPSPSSVIDPDDEMQAAFLDGCGLDPELTRSSVLISVADYSRRLKARKFTADEIREAAATWHEYLPHRAPEDLEPPHPNQLAEWVARRRASKAMASATSKARRPAGHLIMPFIER